MNNEQRYAKIRAGFVSKGTSLNKWCKENGYHRQNAYAAIMGEWVGDKASALCRLLMTESGVCVQAVTESSPTATGWDEADPRVDRKMDGSGADIP